MTICFFNPGFLVFEPYGVWKVFWVNYKTQICSPFNYFKMYISLIIFIIKEFIKIKYGIYPKLFYKKMNLETDSLSSVLPLPESLENHNKQFTIKESQFSML